MKRALILIGFLSSSVSLSVQAEPLDGTFELVKINDKPAAELLRAPETMWARYLLNYTDGKVTARIQQVRKTADADKFFTCDAAVSLPIAWKGQSYTVAEELTGESTFVLLGKSKEGTRIKVSTDKKTCTVFLKKGTFKAAKTKDGGATLTTETGDVFTLGKADPEPNYPEILK